MTDTMQSPAANTAGAEPIIRIEAVDKWYGKFQVLTDIHLNVAAGERIVVCGPSGSGKTTLLTLCGALRSIEEGSVKVLGHELNGASQAELVAIRQPPGSLPQSLSPPTCLGY